MAVGLLHIVIITIVVTIGSVEVFNDEDHASNSLDNCGYQSCPTGDPDKLNVHLISHSHWDVGRIETVDNYFYKGVQYIIDTVLDELDKDHQKRFIFVETAYLWRWWDSRGWQDRRKFVDLIHSGRLEIVGGGWTMNDEATTHYGDIVDQMTLGLRFLNATFGECARPKVAWQIDTAGHSREMGSLLAQMGYDGVFFGRIDHQDKQLRERSKTMEFVWNASANLGLKGQLFGVVLPNVYNPPSGFCFDIFCTDDPIKDNPNMKDYNVNDKVDQFLEKIHEQSRKYSTNHLIITMGQDFSYQNARTWFVNLDKLIKHVNARSDGDHINVFYSTPSCYLQALNRADQTWPVKTDDFFPYASESHLYWTGYFASRPALKRYIKYTYNILQVAKQLSVVARLDHDNEQLLETMRRYQAESQHHDAITGTAVQHVIDDYVDSLSKALSSVETSINQAYSKLMPKGVVPSPPQQFCHYLNISYCPTTEIKNASYTVTAYNPLAHTVRSHIRLPLTSQMFQARGPDGNPMDAQIVPVSGPVQNHPEHQGGAQHEIVFVYDLPPLGYATFFVVAQPDLTAVKKSINEITNKRSSTDDLFIENEYARVIVDSNSGLIKSVTNLLDNKTHSVKQNFYYYKAMAGNIASGLQIFRPNGTKPVPVSNMGTKINVTLIKGSEVQEIHQIFNDYVSQVIRIYKGEHGVEFEWQIGPIPIEDGIGKEVITRFDTDFNTKGLFYTDSNGREILERKRNSNPNVDEPIAANYYPVTGIVYIKDDVRGDQMTIATDRSQGASSMEDGSIEIMIHRRLLYADNVGVNEPLNELGVDGKGSTVRGKHRLLLTTLIDAPQLHRAVSLMMSLSPVITVATMTTSVTKYLENYHTSYSGLNGDLPGNVNLLTLESWKEGMFLIRLEHYFEKRDDSTGLSQPVTLNLKNLFSPFTVTDVQETSLGANMLAKDRRRLQWKTEDRNTLPEPQSLRVFAPTTGNVEQKHRYVWGHRGEDHLDVTLDPMEIKTFIVTVTDRHVI